MVPELPPGQQLVAEGKWPIIGERNPQPSDRPWTLTIATMEGEPRVLSVDDLRTLPQTEATIDIHCVTRWSKLGVNFRGIRLKDLLSDIEVPTETRYVSFVSRSPRNHSTSLDISTALKLETLIALEADGQPITESHGGPIRNIVPGRYFYKSVKWLEKIDLLPKDRLGYWEAESGYHNEADPWKEQRYMAPTLDRREAAKLIAARDFSGRDLRSIDGSQRQLQELKAIESLLRDANFCESNLDDADFTSANLSNAHFRNASLRGVSFRNADLEGADLSGADLRNADFSGSSLIGCSFFDPQNPTESQAQIDSRTILPEDVILPLFPEQLAYVRSAIVRTNG